MIKKRPTRVVVLAAVLVAGMAGQGQIFQSNPNAGPLQTVAGTVYDSSGAPAPGVEVLLVPPTFGVNDQIRSDANGKYTVHWQGRPAPPGQTAGPVYSLVARDLEHNAVASHPIDEKATNLDLHLKPGLTISAKVEDANGRAITNAAASLIIISAGGSGSSMDRLPVNANAEGRVQFTALPQGYRYSLTVRASGYGISRPSMIQAADTQTVRLDLPAIVLQPANLKLAGQVLGADGQPVAAARVFVSGPGQPATNLQSDATGHFTFNVCEGTVNLTASIQGATGRTQTTGDTTNVVIRLNNLNNNGVLARAALTITGMVFDPSGAPAPGVAVSVTPAGGLMQDLRSDAGGKFAVSWQPMNFGGARGGLNVQYLLMGRDLEHNFAAIVKVDEETKNMDLHLQGGLALSGSVQDNNGAPVRTALLQLVMMTPPFSSQLTRQPGTVDEQGAFALSALPQGQGYNLNVTAPGYGSAITQITANQTQTASLQLPPFKLKLADQRLEGRVVDADDKPVSGAQVQINGLGQPNDSVRTDSDGHFDFSHVCAGAVRVFAFNPNAGNGGGIAQGNVLAQGGDLNVVVKLGVNQGMAGAGPAVRQAPPRMNLPKEQFWTWTSLRNWPQEHETAIMILLGLQLTASLGLAGGVFWVARGRRS